MKRGFTLSEVLITLVIIGVIAAITIPNVIANSRRQESSAKLKKAYSVLCQASIKSKAMGDDWEIWAESASNAPEPDKADTAEKFSNQYLLPYLNYMKTEKKDNKFYVYLTDGMNLFVWFGGCVDIGVDLNGDKKPNTWGIDQFDFLYCPYSQPDRINGRIAPSFYTARKITREEALNRCKFIPHECTALLSMDNWEFKEDYPYKI